MNNANLLPVESLTGECVQVFGAYCSDGFHPDGQLLNDVLHGSDLDPNEVQENLHREQKIHQKNKKEFQKYVKELAQLAPGRHLHRNFFWLSWPKFS